MPKSTVPAERTPVQLQRLQELVVTVPIRGKTPVIPHRWSDKSKRLMAEKQAHPGVRPKREAKDPAQEAFDSCYWLNGKPAMPATAFKAAMVAACRFFDGLPMTQAKLFLYVEGEGPDQLIPIEGESSVRQDTPRNADGTADLRYRYQFYPWSAVLKVHFLPSVLTVDSVFALIDAAGRGGVGDWRPNSPKSATGTFGQFEVIEE